MMRLSARYLSKYSEHRVKVNPKNPKHISMGKHSGDTKATANLLISRTSTALLLVVPAL